MYQLITSYQQFGPFQVDLAKVDRICLDTETSGLDCHTNALTILQLKLGEKIYIFDVRKLGVKSTAYLLDLIKSSNKLVIGHNIKFDLKFLYKFADVLLFNTYDTMLGEILITCGVGEKYYSYKDLVKQYCSVELSKEERSEFIDNPDIVLTEQTLIYSALDVMYLDDIYLKQQVKLVELKLDRVANEIEMPCTSVVAEMEFNGITLDTVLWKKLEDEARINAEKSAVIVFDQLLDKIVNTIEYKTVVDICRVLKIKEPIKTKKGLALAEQITHVDYVKQYLKDNLNLNSHDQMLAVLNEVYKVPITSTNEKVVNKYLFDYPIIVDLLTYRGFIKGASSFGETYSGAINPNTNRIHTSYNQIQSTGRFSSEKPNMQNIKRESEYRDGFIASEGHVLICADYSQQELRVLAQVSRDRMLIKMFMDNIDPHTFTASNLFGIPLDQVTKDQRYKGKTMNFSVVYGISAWGLKRTLDIPETEAQAYLDKFFNEIYVGVRDFFEQAGKAIWQMKRSVTLSGRKRFFENKIIFDSPKEFEKYKAAMLREGRNAIIQGTSADITKTALILMQRNNPFGKDFKPLLQVHDEIVCEAKEEIKEEAKDFVEKCMLEAEGMFVKIVPCAVDCKISTRWTH